MFTPEARRRLVAEVVRERCADFRSEPDAVRLIVDAWEEEVAQLRATAYGQSPVSAYVPYGPCVDNE